MNYLRSRTGPVALIPFLVFITCFLGTGYLLDDFYALPAPIAVVVGIVSAVLILRGSPTSKIDTLLRGCGDPKILTMCLIYLLAGGFATVTGAMGGIDSVVNLGLTYISVEFLPAGVFIIAAFLSLSAGTSVGSIVALGPIAIGLADQSGISLALMGGSLLGGAMFGDNLSIISDTTIAATQSLGVSMKDKFRVNIYIALPAAILTVILLYFLGREAGMGTGALPTPGSFSLVEIFPYLLVLVLAVSGLNVFYVLFIGIVVAGFIGLYKQDFSLLGYTQEIYDGFLGMTDIFLLSLLTGGLAAMVQKAGGIDYILKKIQKRVKTKRSAQVGIGALVGFTNAAIANNTVSIIITGPVAKQINDLFRMNPRKTATILDIFACLVQGSLPYGAQMLLLVSFAGGRVAYLDLLGQAWYLPILFMVTLVAIFYKPWDRLVPNTQPSSELL